MADYRDAFRLLWIPGLVSVRKRPSEGLHEWLSNGTFALSAGPDDRSIVFEAVDPQPYLLAVAADINRLSSAARETLCNIPKNGNLPRSTAWPLVVIYYAALFHAHVLLRMWGISVSYFRTQELIKLRQTAAAYGLAEIKFKTGQYLLTTDLPSGRVYMTAQNSGGGSHELLWHQLDTAMNLASDKLAASQLPSKDKQDIEPQLDMLMRLVNKAGAGAAWLSSTRNDIQYRQAHGVWFPYANSLTVEKLASRLSAALSGEIEIASFDLGNKDPVVAFAEACIALTVAIRGTLSDMLNRNPSGSFLKYGPMRVENILAAKE